MTQRTDLVVIVPALLALRAYIDEHYDGSISKFARENKLDVADISKIIRQQRVRRITVAYADKIEKATQGRVGIRMWLPVVRRAT